MKGKDLQSKSKGELAKLLAETKQKATNAHFLSKTKKSKNVKEYAGLRKDVARIMTVLKTK